MHQSATFARPKQSYPQGPHTHATHLLLGHHHTGFNLLTKHYHGTLPYLGALGTIYMAVPS